MKAVVFTLGCKVNSCESSALANGLKDMGYEVSIHMEFADVYIINTCAVTMEAQKKSRQMVAKALKLNSNAKIIITGCASQKNPEDFENREGVTLVTGTKAKDKILSMLDKRGVQIEQNDSYYEEYLPAKNNFTRAYIKVQDGCNNFCSYCIIPYLRGRTRSREPKNVIREIEYLAPLESVITGINLSAYDYQGMKLAGLMAELKNLDCRIRLGSLEVNVIDEEFLNSLKLLKNFAPHFHLSLQSGSDYVLKSMNRHYTTEQYLQKCQLIREHFPNCAITTDVIVGYSTEEDIHFEETIQTVKNAKFADIHIFPYSRRAGTVGYKLPPISDDIKKSRLAQLTEVKNGLKEQFINENIGKTLQFVPEYAVDDYTVGYTSNYLWTYIKGSMENKITNCKIISNYKDGVLAVEV